MKVLLISHTCQSRTEGQPKAVELARLGIELRVVVPRRWKHYGQWRFAESPIDFTEEPSAKINTAKSQQPSAKPAFTFTPMTVKCPWCGPAQSYLHWYPGLSRLLLEWQPDVIDLWEEPWSLVSAQTCWLRDRICPTAAIVSETEQNIDKNLPFPFEPFRTFVLKKADFMVGRNSEAIEIVQRKGFKGPTRVVPNAVDAQLFHRAQPQARARKRFELGWKDDVFMCGYVGRLVEEKGLADFVEAIAQCPPHVHAVLVGSGPFEPNVREHITKLKLEARVHLIPAQELNALASVMSALDTLVLPSRTTARWKEQFGRVIIEAQACGIPVVGSSSGAIPDVVGEAGIVFPERDVAQLAASLTLLASNPDLCNRLGQRGEANVSDYYTWTRVAENMADIYQEISGGKTSLSPS